MNWPAIRLAKVSPVANTDAWMPLLPAPITCVTAIASPIARPRPRITAAPIPAFDEESTTPRTISQRVEPSASAASSSSLGTLRNSSRQMLATIGTTMIASTSEATKIPLEPGLPLKMGRKPIERRLDVVRDERAEHEDPPEAQHDARDGREQLDERAHGPPHATGRELAQEERDRNRQGGRDQQCDQRGDRGSEEELRRAVDLFVRVPDRIGDE